MTWLAILGGIAMVVGVFRLHAGLFVAGAAWAAFCIYAQSQGWM